MSGNGLMFPGMQAMQPTLAVAQPINDVQLVALLAAQLVVGGRDSIAEAVDDAIFLFADAIAKADRIGQAVRERKAELHAG